MAQEQQVEALRAAYEEAVIERMKESGFLEVEIRVECLVRCGDTYQDSQISYGWWAYQLAALQSAQAAQQSAQGSKTVQIFKGQSVGKSEAFPLLLEAQEIYPSKQGLDAQDANMFWDSSACVVEFSGSIKDALIEVAGYGALKVGDVVEINRAKRFSAILVRIIAAGGGGAARDIAWEVVEESQVNQGGN